MPSSNAIPATILPPKLAPQFASSQLVSPQHTSSSDSDSDFSSLDQCLRQAVDRARNYLLQIGYYGYRITLTEDWTAHGYESEDHYRQSLGVSRSMWRDYTALGTKLSHLSLEDMQELTVSAAKSLARVRTDLWQEFPWLEEAKLLPAGEFEVLVKQRLAQHPIGGRGRALREPRHDIRMAVPASQHAKLESRLEALRVTCGLGSTGETLALALAAAEKLARMAKTSPAAQAALERSVEEAKHACA